jgi:hypothetical protein
MLKIISLAVVFSLALGACGSSAESAQRKQAVITAALQKVQTEYEQARRNPPKGLNRADVLGSIVLVYAPPPKGISAAEWNTAIRNDRTLQREFNPQKK